MWSNLVQERIQGQIHFCYKPKLVFAIKEGELEKNMETETLEKQIIEIQFIFKYILIFFQNMIKLMLIKIKHYLINYFFKMNYLQGFARNYREFANNYRVFVLVEIV